MLADILIPLAAGFCDRVRGGFPDDKLYDKADLIRFKNQVRTAVKFLYGMALIAPLATAWWHYLVAGVTWKFGEQLAGDFGGTFRFGAGADYPVGPLVRVGFLWPALTASALAYWIPEALLLIPISLVATLVSAPLAVIIHDTPRVPVWLLELRTWPAWQEFLRGYLMGLGMVLVSKVV